VLLAMVVVVLAWRRLRPQWLESPGSRLPHVASTCFKCSRCFVGMFQVFHANVAKVDRDVAYVVMIVHVCCKCLFPMFRLFFSDVCCKCVHLDVPYVSQRCCNYYIWMLHMFAIVFQVFSCVFACVSCTYFECFSYFVRILQLFHLDVSKIDSGCRACCNVSHLPQLPTAAARAPCMEGSGVASVEGAGSREAWGSGADGPCLCV
jgi:hypothetical protein